ncbi:MULTISPECIES: SDR family oxidoreductase [unclassified Polaribacter]|uniref:SDR family oxidoreductase n=1 Tax=unclassified Polaribacter TaxID=196858 RepID=UPI0011BD54E5|nr:MULTISPECIES: SDR family oxidoreductase [unclassified Polaribacter]TXD52007.1 SDR family oxidoreductase [Polaribacter sp. IC063]TXD58675.1 SDR family oxidoreductase [Polaribacter sp. IC066]
MNNEKQNILIAGANGTTGRIIVQLLKDSDIYRPIAMVRKQEQKDRFEQDDVTAIIADLEKDLNHAVKNADKVIFAAGSKGKKVIEVDQEGAKQLINAAKDAKVRKFVMLSSMGADNPSVSKELEGYLKAKQNADEYLKASGLHYTIVRPGSLTDLEGTGKIQLKEKLENFGKISRADVAQTLVKVLEDDVRKNQVFEIITGETVIQNAVTPH